MDFRAKIDNNTRRKQEELNLLQQSLVVLQNKTHFCQKILRQELSVFGRPRDEIQKELRTLEFSPFPSSEGSKASYDYLLRLPLDSFSKERVLALENEYNTKKEDFDRLSCLSVKDLWMGELKTVEEALLKEQ